jgi:hypothetical protein
MEKKKLAERIRFEVALEKEERMELIFTKYVEYKYPLKILSQLWIYKFIRRKINSIGPLNNRLLNPYLQFNAELIEKKEARIKTLKIYVNRILFVLMHIAYLSLIAYYDSFLYDKVMYDWLEEIMKTKY